jgi:Undecaprenyl-phosphate glucose phosphotransferase
MEQTRVSYRALARRRRGFDHDAIAYLAAIVDFSFILIASIAGPISYQHFAFRIFVDPTMYFGIGLVMAAMFVLAMSCAHAYRQEDLMSTTHQILLICILIPGVLAFLLAVVFFLKLGEEFSRGAILNLAVISVIGLIATRYIWRRRLPWAIAYGMFRTKRALLVCPQNLPLENLENLSVFNGIIVTQVARIFEDGPPANDFCASFLKAAKLSKFDEVIVVWRDSRISELESFLAELRRLPLPVKVIFDSYTGSVVSCPSERIAGMTAFQVQRSPLSVFERAIKRTFDIAFSAVALTVLSPMLVVIAVAIKLDSKGPVFFRQYRKGHGSQPFQILKFRSMTVGENGADVRQATKDDPRVTRVGRFIRSLSMDELPQFWNVLRGEMSVVGPRPHAIAHDDIYDALISDYAFRRHVKPGVTGWAQVRGHRGETPTVDLMERRVSHDLWYIDNWSFWLDLEIVLRTMFKLHSPV